MFVVIAIDAAFVATGAAMWAVPLFFIGVLVVAGLLGEAVARFYSERMNRWLRARWNDGARQMGSLWRRVESRVRRCCGRLAGLTSLSWRCERTAGPSLRSG